MPSSHSASKPGALICLAVAASLTAPLFAATPSEQRLSTISVTEEADSYNAEAAASSKTGTPLRDDPQSISVITRQTIDDLNVQSIGDAMNYVPGIGMAQGEGNRETPVIRGNSSTGDFFLDGMRDDVQYYRDLYNIEQLEVLKGPNGMLFGRGGVGGLINRVTKQADGRQVRSLALQAGSYSNKRASIDVGQALNGGAAVRLNAMYEDSDTYRDDVFLRRYGVNPTVGFTVGDATSLRFGVEYFHDERTADRGVSSYLGAPLKTDAGAFFGDPALSPTDSTVKSASALVEHRFSETALLRNRTRYADYDKFYQNVFPGAVNTAIQNNPAGLPAGSYAPGTTVQIAAYNNATARQNFFNQTDLQFTLDTGAVQHKLLTGLELGHQKTANFRQTGYFDSIAPSATAVFARVSNPRTTLPVAFRQSATDADNDGTAKTVGLYVQDEIIFSPKWHVVAGLRYDNFKVDLTNNRNGARFSSKDDLFSPRLALVHKPVEAVSLYASYGLTYQPRAGDQLASLSASNAALDPERFTNYEIGAKWDALPNLALTAALFRLERSNIAVTDPQAGLPGGPPAGTLILVKGQRNQGLELGATGNVTDRWSLIGAFAYQDGEVTQDQSATVLAGARLAALPKVTYSLWNRYDFSNMWGAGLGIIHKGEILAATENLATPSSNVTLPSFTRVDAAAYFTFTENLRAQVNIENLLEENYFQFANSNTNVTPGSPRAFRVTLTASF
ncbi:MAG: TonB-dependent siderophore receptor [Steroidobacteraceae bacterium]